MKYIVILFALIATTFFAGRSTFIDSYQIGDTVTTFRLKNVDGKMISLSDYKSSKGVILIFDCNTCPYSRAYNDRIIALHEKYSVKGFPVVTINSNDPQMSPGDSFEEMVKRSENKKYKFPYLFDESQEVARAFGATNTPHVYVLEKYGNDFKVAYIGAIDNNSRDGSSADKKYVEDAVNALLNGDKVPVTKTKAIGCSIKYRNS
ncbi:MAG TPA: thioredoxin family protein [Cyclobacteriaceae bacterium]|nr:thioredoxin family protein [Cyclobacteriaceae bacterium]